MSTPNQPPRSSSPLQFPSSSAAGTPRAPQNRNGVSTLYALSSDPRRIPWLTIWQHHQLHPLRSTSLHPRPLADDDRAGDRARMLAVWTRRPVLLVEPSEARPRSSCLGE